MKRYAIIKYFVDTAEEETSVFEPNRLLYLCSSDADSSQAAISSSDNGVETTRQKHGAYVTKLTCQDCFIKHPLQ